MERFPMEDLVPEEPETRELLSAYSDNGQTRFIQDGDCKKRPQSKLETKKYIFDKITKSRISF